MWSKERVAEFNRKETPFYFYDLAVLKKTLEIVKQESSKYGFHVHYALKANTNTEILNIICNSGFGADCVSGNEIKAALETGFSADNIAFAGVGKTDKEILLGLEYDIFSFNCESIQEIKVINDLGKKINKIANIALRINPDVNADTHKYITTGLEENKFGINKWELPTVIELIKQCSHINLVGLHFHIGSQITSLTPFKNLCTRVNSFREWFETQNMDIKHVNVGGGLGIDYADPDGNTIPDFENYFKLFNDFIELQPHQQLHFELGRAIVGQCGSLISRVLYVKEGVKTNFVILDAGMTELIRPALYQSSHKIENITKGDVVTNKYDVVGPICESSDCFGKAIDLPHTERGDLIAIRSAGAYGEVMASQYNLRDRVKSFCK